MDLSKKFEEEVNSSKNGVKTPCLLGVKHELLTVVDYRYNRNRQPKLIWICKCDCGNVAYIRTLKHLKKRKGCQSCTSSLMSSNKKHNIPHYSYYTRKLKEYKDGANKRHLDFKLTQSQVFELFKGNCYYCGTKPIIKTSSDAWKISSESLIFNGIDRIDSSQGYTEENTVSCCTTCNYGKHKQSEQEFIKWIQKVYNYQMTK